MKPRVADRFRAETLAFEQSDEHERLFLLIRNGYVRQIAMRLAVDCE